MIRFNEQEKTKNTKKAFTLIELLAVIIILGILMIIAVPAVTKYIGDSRRNGYVNTAKEIINGARNLVHSGTIDISDENATYYMPTSCIKIDNQDPTRSPYGVFDQAYVIFGMDEDGKSYDYYWMSRDETGHGVKVPVDADELDVDDIEDNVSRQDIHDGISTINNNQKLLLFNSDCSSSTEQNISSFGRLLPVNECTFDGEMIQGAEFTDGQYTYRYMQDALPTTNPDELWNDISEDGWGVVLTDKSSTAPVNTRICTSINDKPIVSMNYMFYNSNTTDIDVSSFDTSHVKYMLGMFQNVANVEELDLSYFDTSELIYLSLMFFDDANLETLTMDNWNLRKSSPSGSLLVGCPKLKTVSAKNWKVPQYLTSWISWSWGGGGSPIETIDVTGWDLSETESISGLFGGSRHLKNIIGLSTWDTSNIKNMSSLFTSCSSLTSIDLSNFNTRNVTDLSAMFAECSGLTSVNLSSFDTRNVTDLSNMFYGCASLTSIDLSHFRTPKLEKYYNAFLGCSNLRTINIDNWDLTNTEENYNMFSDCNSLERVSMRNWKIPQYFEDFVSTTRLNRERLVTLDVTGWDLTNTVDISGLFADGSNIEDIIGINTWNTSNIQNMSRMFYSTGKNAYEFDIDISSWNTVNVRNMDSMFMFAGQDAYYFDIDLSSWNTRNVTSMSHMFSYAGQNCGTWDVGTLSNWNVSNVTDMSSMFDGAAYYASTFDLGDLSSWDTRNVNNMFAMFYSAGVNANYWGNIGTFKIYASNISSMFSWCERARATLNIYNNPSSYDSAFYVAATEYNSGITVNYSSNVVDIDNIIATKWSSSKITKGSILN